MGRTYKENRDKYRKHLQKKDKKTKWKKPQSFGDVPDYDKRLPVDLDDVVDSDSFSADGW